MLIVGAALGIYITSSKERKDNETRFLDFRSDINNKLLSLPEKEVLNNIKITYKDCLINNLTSVVISVYNLSDRDYENVPIYITLKSLRNKDSLNIIQSSFEDMNGLPEQIEFIKEIPTPDNSKRFHYNIKTANRASSLKAKTPANKNSSDNLNMEPGVPVLTLSYLLTGSMLLQVKADIAKKGMEIRKYDYENYEQMCISKPKYYILMCSVGFVYLLFFWEITKIVVSYFRKNAIAKKIAEEKRCIAEALTKEFPHINDLPDIVGKIYEVKKKDERSKEGWLKKLLRMRIFFSE